MKKIIFALLALVTFGYGSPVFSGLGNDDCVAFPMSAKEKASDTGILKVIAEVKSLKTGYRLLTTIFFIDGTRQTVEEMLDDNDFTPEFKAFFGIEYM